MDTQEEKESFKELLNQEYQWPAKYTFKFIVKAEHKKTIGELFSEVVEIAYKPSTGNKYVSVTIHAQMKDADAIVAIYEAASGIPGIISL